MALPKRPKRIDETPEENIIPNDVEEAHLEEDHIILDDSEESDLSDEGEESDDSQNIGTFEDEPDINLSDPNEEMDLSEDDQDIFTDEAKEVLVESDEFMEEDTSTGEIPSENVEGDSDSGSPSTDIAINAEATDALEVVEKPDSGPVVARPGSLSSKNRMAAFEHQASNDVSVEEFQKISRPKNARKYERTEPVAKPEGKLRQRKFVNFGGITADFAVYGNYENYIHLENEIHEMVKYVQEVLSDQGHSEKVGNARRERGSDLHKEMYMKIDRIITREISSGKGISVMPKDASYFTAAVNNEILGFGPLEPLWQDPRISEIMVNGPHDIRVEIKGVNQTATGVRFRDTAHAMTVASNFLALSGRTFSTKMPYADGSLPDGSRLNAIHPEVAPGGPYLTIRRFPDTIFSLKKLVELGSMDEDMAHIIGNLVHHGVSIVIAGGTGTGKAIDVETPIPTPSGFIRLKDLQIGDTVFGANGQPVTITGYYPQPENECFEVSFSDNSSVIADAEHNWFVNGSILTTREIFETQHAVDYSVPLTKPVQYPERELPIDPYVLGYWIADGAGSGILEDETGALGDTLSARGVEFNKVSETLYEVAGLSDSLDALGLTNGVESFEPLFVPEEYIIASEGQRRALLAGILDNGAILHEGTGYIELVFNENSVFALQSIQIISSLGYLAKKRTLEYNGVNIYSVVFETADEVFSSVPRNAVHQATNPKDILSKDIVQVKKTESVDVACISVDSPDHLYLFGQEYTVTHNTSMLNALSGCIPEDQRIITVEDTLELQLNPSKHVLSLRSRPPNPKGEDAVTIRDLVRNTLRMKPDRIVVGEVRDASAYDMMQAMNTGHDGSLTTTHASNADGTIERLALLTAEAGEVTPDRAYSLIAGAVDIIVNIERYTEDGSRRVSGVHEVPSKLSSDANGRVILETTPIWEWIKDGQDPATDAIYGHYERTNEFSESLDKKHALSKRKDLPLEELFRISAVPEKKPIVDDEE